ncbi:MAG: serine/threonine-protein kinase [Pseudomonadota bacterium]
MPARTSIGELIADRYQVVRLIARGGMGSVFEARQVALDRPVAIKFLNPPISHLESEREAFEKRFNLEAAALARLSDPNIVSVFDYGQTEDGRSFLVMEYIDGPPLATVLKEESPLDPLRAVRLMVQVCSALRNAHMQEVVHRDLKPNNLLIKRAPDGSEQVKVVDFGLVKLSREDQSITMDGAVMGSPHYMAPEQIRGAETDERADIYAIGALLFRCVTTHPPFSGPTSTATMLAHLQEPVPNLAAAAPGATFPTGLEPIIHRCLQKQPADRFANVGELKAALDGLLRRERGEVDAGPTLSPVPAAQLGLSAPPAPEPEPELDSEPDTEVVDDPPARRSLLPWVLVAIAAAVILALVFRPRSEPTEPLPGPPSVQPAASPTTPAAPPSPAPVAVRLHITSEPAGATVSLDGEPLGTTPFVYETTTGGAPDSRRFGFALAGHQGRTVEQELGAGGDLELSAELQPSPGSAKPAPPTPAPATKPVEVAPPAPAPPSTPDGYKKSPYD